MFSRSGNRVSSVIRLLNKNRDLRILRNEGGFAHIPTQRHQLFSSSEYRTGKHVEMPSMFDDVKNGPPDPMFDLKKRADNDASSGKVDLGVGIYRSEQGKYHELRAVKAVCCLLR